MAVSDLCFNIHHKRSTRRPRRVQNRIGLKVLRGRRTEWDYFLDNLCITGRQFHCRLKSDCVKTIFFKNFISILIHIR